MRQEIFGATVLGNPLEATLDDIILFRFTQEFFGYDQSGIVIAGFGEDELLPALRSYTVEYVIADELRSSPGERVNVGLAPDQAAFVMPFAQSDEMLSFVFGSPPALHNHYRTTVEERLRSFSGDLLSLAGVTAASQPTMQPQVQTLVQAQLLQFDQEMLQHRLATYLNPVYQAVRALPKEDLASMAEALVSLTSLRRKASMDLQTVGGPVDVAVISKGDGFIWLRRKHYFETQLNPQFLANYYR